MSSNTPNIDKRLLVGERLVVSKFHDGGRIHAKIGVGPTCANALGRTPLQAIDNLELFLDGEDLPPDMRFIEDPTVEAVVWYGPAMNAGIVLTRTEARKLVDGRRFFWNTDNDTLVWRGPASELRGSENAITALRKLLGAAEAPPTPWPGASPNKRNDEPGRS